MGSIRTYPLKVFDPRQPAQTTRLTEQHVDNGGSLSPDERWLAYQSAAAGRSVVYVRPLTTPGPAVALSSDPGEFPVFLPDGKTLALVRGRQLVLRSWRDDNGRFEIGPERVVTRLEFGSGWTYGAPYDVAEGGRFLALVRTEASPPPRIRVVMGWDGEVTRLGVARSTLAVLTRKTCTIRVKFGQDRPRPRSLDSSCIIELVQQC